MSTATYNLGDGPDHRKVTDLLTLADMGADVIGLQEAGDRGAVLFKFLTKHPRWGLFSDPHTPGSSSVPILYRLDRFALVKAEAVIAVPAMNVGPDGAGPSRAKAKVVNRVHLTHTETGRTVHVLNTHMLPSVTRKDLSEFETATRRAHYAQHIAALAATVNARDGVVFVTGDFNAPPTFDLLQPLKDARLVGWSETGTHGTRPIDHVLSREAAVLTGVRQELLDLSSDHRAVVNYHTLQLKETPA